MRRGYLNSLSFPAESVEEALHHLNELRLGIGRLVADRSMTTPIMCNIRAAQLPLSPDYRTLVATARDASFGFRDTVLFFLTALDQRSPVHAALAEHDQAEAHPSAVNGVTCDFDPDAETALVACALDNGFLLSIGTTDHWRSSPIEITMLTATAQTEQRADLINVFDQTTAEAANAIVRDERERFQFANWDYLTDGALRAVQIDDWFDECRRRPGLEQLVMRTVAQARAASWLADGELVKKLTDSTRPMYEVRAYYHGSNNVRLLFGRDSSGVISFGYGGLKTSPDWYDHAMLQAAGFIWPT